MIIKTYSTLSALTDFKSKYKYLRLNGTVGKETFGFDRYISQNFYKSHEWKSIRDFVIVRDNGCDLGVEGYEIYGKVLIHHLNPIAVKDIIDQSELLLNPEYLISTTFSTHNAIHYGDERLIISAPVKRNKYDTCPWRH